MTTAQLTQLLTRVTGGTVSCIPRHQVNGVWVGAHCTTTPTPVITPEPTPTTMPPSSPTNANTTNGDTNGTGIDSYLAGLINAGTGSGTGTGAGSGIYVPPTSAGTSSSTGNPTLIIAVIALVALAGYWIYSRSKHKAPEHKA